MFEGNCTCTLGMQHCYDIRHFDFEIHVLWDACQLFKKSILCPAPKKYQLFNQGQECMGHIRLLWGGF